MAELLEMELGREIDLPFEISCPMSEKHVQLQLRYARSDRTVEINAIWRNRVDYEGEAGPGVYCGIQHVAVIWCGLQLARKSHTYQRRGGNRREKDVHIVTASRERRAVSQRRL